MRQLIAFTKKEGTELVRSGKLMILTIIFILFGIMNPAVAKLTPWMMSLMEEELAEAGMMLTEVNVDALTSWTQFYKNVPMALIIFVIMLSGTLTMEYQRGTLINMVTKGLPRWKVIIAKFICVTVFWTVCYWMCYGITYLYNMYFWDNSIANCLSFAAFLYYLFGVWVIALVIMISSMVKTNTGVLAAVGGIIGISYFLSFLPKAEKYLPTKLMSAGNLLAGGVKAGEYYGAMWIVLGLSILAVVVSILQFNQKNL